MQIIIRRSQDAYLFCVSYLLSAREESLMHAFLLVMSSGVLSSLFIVLAEHEKLLQIDHAF